MSGCPGDVPAAGSGDAASVRSVIEVRNLHKAYAGDHRGGRRVVHGAATGRSSASSDANGAGKTTTVECVAGLRSPDRGDRSSVLGLDPRRDRAELTQLLGVQLQESQLPREAPGRRGAGPVQLLLPARPPTGGQLTRERSGLRRRRSDPVPRSCPAGRSSGCRSCWRLVGAPGDRGPRRADHRASTRRPGATPGS